MSKINERQIGLKTGGNFTLLKDYLDKRQVKMSPFSETVLTVSSASFIELPAATWAGFLAVGAATTENDGAVMTGIGLWAIGTPAFSAVTAVDGYGNVLNLVDIREATSHDPIYDTDGKKVYGMLTSAATSSDGDAVGATGVTANFEVSFVKNDGSGVFVAVTLDGTYEIHLNKVYQARFDETIELAGGAKEVDVIADLTTVHYSDLLVTADFAAAENITIASGAGSVSGTSTRGGDGTAITLNASAAAFVADNTCKMTLNGIKGTKGLAAGGKDFDYVSATVFTTNGALDIGDIVGIERKY